jgi:hypothetical protein
VLSVRSRKLSNVRRGQSLGGRPKLSRAPPFFGRHVKLLVPAALAVFSTVSRRVDVRQAAGHKIIAESLSHDEKHVVPNPFSSLVEKRF